ncbi:MAG TPA: transposase, partial [Thermoanaerobaculia bacterium]|jgi:REP element-mobilizing transposase RayT
MNGLVRDRAGVLGTYDSGEVKVHRRKKLPHWDAAHGVQFITFCVGDGRQLSHEDARVVEDVIKHDDGRRYALLVWCVMPDHAHVIVRPKVPVADIVKTWKSVSARPIAGGTLWQEDYFDRLIRNSRELADTIDYVMNNPEAAQLEGWDHKGMYPDRIGECV